MTTTDAIKTGTVSIDGVVIGMVMQVDRDGTVHVVFPGNPSEAAIPARATVPFSARDVGAEVALIFERGDPARPIAMGRLLRPAEFAEPEEEDVALPPAAAPTVQVDGQEEDVLQITGREQIVLRCGKASITLTRDGKVLIRGAYVSSRATGANRIKGGSIHLN